MIVPRLSTCFIVRTGTSTCISRGGSFCSTIASKIFRPRQQQQQQQQQQHSVVVTCTVGVRAVTRNISINSNNINNFSSLSSSISSSVSASVSASKWKRKWKWKRRKFVSSSISFSSLAGNNNSSSERDTTTSNNNNKIKRINREREREKYSIVIVGSGPSGCYTAKYLLLEGGRSNMRHSNTTTTNILHFDIDIIDRLPTPYGLVRNGVAPDHPEVKNVQSDFDQLFDVNNNYNSNDNNHNDGGQKGKGDDNNNNNDNKNKNRIQFFGNVLVGDNSNTKSPPFKKYNNVEEYSKDVKVDNDTTINDDDDDIHCDVGLDELREMYDIVVLAYGCESDRELKLQCTTTIKHQLNKYSKNSYVPDSSVIRTVHYKPTVPTSGFNNSYVDGVLSARQFVNWYNGHPDYDWVTDDVQKALSTSNSTTTNTQNIVIIGHGNVAIDCARILAKSRKSLTTTDITTRALDVLRPPLTNDPQNQDTQIVKRNINVVGRRGHIQGAFTIKEIRELTKLSDTSSDSSNDNDGDGDAILILRRDELEKGMTDTSKQELEQMRQKQRIHKLLIGHCANNAAKYAVNAIDRKQQHNTRVNLRFLLNPVRYEKIGFQLKSVICERTKLIGDEIGRQKAIPMIDGTDVDDDNDDEIDDNKRTYETIDADLCLVSIGYKGESIDCSTSTIYNSHNGTLRNDRGRVVDIDAYRYCDDGDDIENYREKYNNYDNNKMAAVYVSGWLKRGPSGIIGTNICDAKETVESIIEDIRIDQSSQPSLSSSSSSSKLVSDELQVVKENNATNISRKKKTSLEDILKKRNVNYVNWDGYRNIDQCETHGTPTTTTNSNSNSNSDDDDDDNDNDDDHHSSNKNNDYLFEHHKRHPDQIREKLVEREKLIVAANKNKKRK